MSKMFAITVKELRSYFVSPVGYIVLALWLFNGGLWFALNVLSTSQASLQDWFGTIEVIMLLLAPLLTMGLLAQEQGSGTLEVLMTAPVRNWQVVVGKYLAALAFWFIMLALTLIYPLILKISGNPDLGPIFTGYIGMFLFGGAFLAIGVFMSSLTDNQVVAAFAGIVLLLVLWIVGFFQQFVTGPVGQFLGAISVTSHFNDFTSGILDISHILFYLSFMVVALFAAIQILEARRARQ